MRVWRGERDAGVKAKGCRWGRSGGAELRVEEGEMGTIRGGEGQGCRRAGESGGPGRADGAGKGCGMGGVRRGEGGRKGRDLGVLGSLHACRTEGARLLGRCVRPASCQCSVLRVGQLQSTTHRTRLPRDSDIPVIFHLVTPADPVPPCCAPRPPPMQPPQGAGGKMTDWSGQPLVWQPTPGAADVRSGWPGEVCAAGDPQLHAAALSILDWKP